MPRRSAGRCAGEEAPLQKFRLFSSEAYAGDLTRLETQINSWLESGRPHIHHMAQSALGEHLIVSFIYAEPLGEQAQAAASASASVPAIFERTLANADLDPSEEVVVLPEMELPY
jgi:hypothetical protein